MKKNTNEPIEILIAEDSATQAELLKQLLEEHQYSVTTAVNGKIALAQLALRQPALVISDILMPEMDGYELCKAIKSDEKLRHIPVMLVTTLSDAHDVIRGLECGADNFIRKPYEEKYLLSRIDYLLMNLELRKNQKMQLGVEIDLGGHKHFISAERQQILDLLISTYEQAIHINEDLKAREKELAHSNQILQGLNRIAEGINHAASEQEVAEAVLQRALELPGVQAGWIFLRTEESGFRLAAALNLPPALALPGAMDGDCLCRRRLIAGELGATANIVECERLGRAKGDTRGMRCHASIPLWLGERTLGVMNLVGPDAGVFDEAELKVLHNVGNQVAVALERARLHENLEQLVEERTSALRASEARLRTIIEAEPECVKIVDAEGLLVQMNAAGLAMIEADNLEQVLGTRIAELVVPAQREAYRAFEASVLDGKNAAAEFEIVGLKGTHRWQIIHAVPLPDPQDGRPQVLAIGRDVTERKQAEAKLQMFRTLLDKSSDAIEVLDPATLRFLDINETECRVLGYSREELLSMSAFDIDPGLSADSKKMIEAQWLQSGGAQFEAVHRRKDGSTFPVDVSTTFIELDKPYLLSIARDITQRKANEAKIKRLNRIYAVLSGINTTIVHVREEGELFNEACRIAVEHGQLSFAWIGKFDTDTRQVTPVAQAGRDDGYLAQLNLTARENIQGGCALTTQALTEMKPVVCNDIDHDERMAALRSAALSRGYRSVAVFPLMLEGRPLGVLALYAAETDAFDEEEMRLLIEMSGDISYALDNLRLEARRKQAENELRKLSLAVEQSPNSIVITDLDANIEYVNEGFVKATGYSREEVIGRNPSILHSGKNSRESYDDMWAHLTRGEIWKGEFINRRKDGSEYIESIFVSPVRDADSRITHYLSIKEDITERKRMEQELLKSEARYRRITEGLTDYQYTVRIENGSAVETTQSPACVTVTGYTAEEFAANPHLWMQMIVPEDRERVMQHVQQILAGKDVAPMEHRITRKNGESRWISDTSILFRDASGKLLSYDGVIKDITEIKHAETALRDSRENLHRLLNSMFEGVYGVDTDGNCTFVNRAFLQMLGYQDANELLGKHTHELIHHSHADGSPYPASECVMYRACKTNQPSNVSDEVFWRKDGVAIPVEYWSHPIVIDGEMTGAIATFIDITERKQAEVALRQLNESLEQRVAQRTADLEQARHEADDANRAKSAFLSTMSHEIRTPMNGVVGMVEVLAQSRLSEHQADLVKTIRESANVLLGIIDDILDFSKIEAGRLELERTPVSVADLVEGLCNSLVPVAARKGVDLSLFISPDIPERVLSDEVRLRQLLYNLVGNAIKFSSGRPGKQGLVSIRVTIAEAAPLRLALRIADNGIGMAPATMSDLFTPFTQAEISTTRRFGGTGLGLTICKRLADMMQGEIAVESTLGLGSTFTVTLPFEVPAEQPVPSLPDLSGLGCIVLESPQINAGDLRAYLEHAGAKVHFAADAATAVRVATLLPAPVVVILLAEHGDVPVALHAPLSAVSDIRYLLITHGRRRRSRVEGPNSVSMDGDAMRRLALLRAVAVTAGLASPEIFHDRPEEPLAGEAALPTIAEARAQGRLILVAEDDEINQKVILQQLGLLGYAAEISANGVEALRLWREGRREGRYALLLTDLHMPEMDGYTLTENIRSEEAGSERMPILALTANALRGEANRAHSAGMDDYLTKPVQLQLLRATLEKWLPSTGENKAPALQPEQSVKPPAASAVDIAVLQGLIGNDKATVREFLADYLAAARLLAGEMRAALAAGDTRQASGIAHKLKSSSRSVGAMVLGDLCAELENSGKTGDKAAIAQGMAQFETVLAQVETEISVLLQEQ